MFGDLEDLDKMFGELDDSDIYVNNQDTSFDNTPELNIPEEQPADMQQQAQQQQQAPQPPQKSNNTVLVLLVLAVIGAGVYLYKTYFMQPSVPEQTQTVDATAEMGDYFYDKANGENPAPPDATQAQPGGDTVVNVDINSTPAQPSNPGQPGQDPQGNNQAVTGAAQQGAPSPLKNSEQSNLKAAMEKKNVVVAVTNGGRPDPFVPFITAAEEMPVISVAPPKFDIIAPPDDIPEDINPVYNNMVTTKISGIMYDKARPSAIINVGGVDQLVHKGDVVKDYQIIDITKDRVVLKSGTNIYRASVGQEVDGGVNINPVSNLSRQFGGAYKSVSRNIIEINGSN